MSPDHAVLARLKDRTSAAHRSIETVPLLARLLADDLSPAAYVAALGVMHAFHEAVAALAAPARAQLSDAGAAGVDGCLALLAADLAWFGSAPPPAMDLPRPDGLPAALGMLYVAEGAALGGRVIGRHVAARLGVRPGRGGSFYDPDGGGRPTGGWQRFRAMLARAAADFTAEEVAAMEAAAIATFAALEAAMRSQAVPERDRPERGHAPA